MKQLIQALLDVQAELPIIPNDSNGHGGRYQYTSLDSILHAVRPILAKHGLVLSQWPSVPTNPLNIALTTRLMHVEGDILEETLEMPCPEPNKMTNHAQMAGAGFTYARRYAISGILGICSEPDTDAATAVTDATQATANGVGHDPDKAAIVEAPAADFFNVVLDLIPAFRHKVHVINTMRKLGHESVSGMPVKRWEVFQELKAYKLEAVQNGQ